MLDSNVLTCSLRSWIMLSNVTQQSFPTLARHCYQAMAIRHHTLRPEQHLLERCSCRRRFLPTASGLATLQPSSCKSCQSSCCKLPARTYSRYALSSSLSELGGCASPFQLHFCSALDLDLPYRLRKLAPGLATFRTLGGIWERLSSVRGGSKMYCSSSLRGS